VILGASAEIKLIKYLDQLTEGSTFIEIGSTSPPGPFGSTCFFRRLCTGNNFRFYSIDIDEDNHKELLEIDPHLEGHLIHAYGEEFLQNYNMEEYGPISCAYLDGFDWVYNLNDLDLDQVQSYKDRGEELNNTNSQVSHLKQTMYIEQYSDEKCIILYDDTWLCPQQDIYIGKGAASIYYLLSLGWKIIDFDRSGLEVPHQAMMIGKNINE